MAKKLEKRKGNVRIALILLVIALSGVLLLRILERATLWEYLLLAFALVVCATGLVLLSGISGSPRFRRTRAFNPSSRHLKKVEVKKDPPSDPPPPPTWPSPYLLDIVAGAVVANEATYDEPFDTEVEKVLVTITTDAPVLTASFEIEVPNPGTGEFIEEVDVLVMDRRTGLKVKAWAYYGTDVNLPLSQTSIVTVDFA